MYTIEYCEDGVAIPDAQLRSFAAEWSGNPRDIKISTFSAIDAIRLEILNKKVNHSNVQLKFGDTLEVFNQYAQVKYFPKQEHTGVLLELIKGTSSLKVSFLEQEIEE